jgi:hypothetical protein
MDEALHTKWDINLLSRNSAYKELINRKGIQDRSSHGIWFSYGLKSLAYLGIQYFFLSNIKLSCGCVMMMIIWLTENKSCKGQ